MKTEVNETIVPLPHLGEGIEQAELAIWHVAKGGCVNEGDDLCEVVTDKVSFHVAAPCGGIVCEIYAQEEEMIQIGAPLARIALKELSS